MTGRDRIRMAGTMARPGASGRGPGAPGRGLGARQRMRRVALMLLGLCAVAGPAAAQAPLPSGHLCCNLRVYNGWISDINYRHEGSTVIAAGTPVRGTAWGRYSIGLRVGGNEYWLGNDYSRGLDDRQFSRRYIVASDPRARIQAAHPFVRDAIRRSRVMAGMNEAEVAIALGFPVANYTPSLAASQWKYWIDRTGEFTVHFDAERRVRSVTGDGRVLARVLWAPGGDLVRRGQARLNDYGFEAGEPDGRNGPVTRRALREFQSLNGLPEDIINKVTHENAFDLATLKRLGIEH